MRQWRDCKTTAERQGALIEAMKLAQGSVTAAAKLLGLNRQYLHTILARAKLGSDSSDPTDTRDKVAKQDSPALNGAQAPHGVVGATRSGSLTCGHRVPTFPTKMSAETTVTEPEGETLRVAFDLSKRHLDWLEREALRRKQKGELPRQAKSPIVAELIEAAMARKEEDGE